MMRNKVKLYALLLLMCISKKLLLFQGAVKVYHWPPSEGTVFVTNSGLDMVHGALQDTPSNAPVRLKVRVYVIRASGLHPEDLSGKSDPYLVVKLGSHTISDRENYIPRQLNPTFGRYIGCFNGVPLVHFFQAEHRIQFGSHPMQFLGFSNYEKGGWSIVRSA
jgi:hypothetical protein